MDLIDPYARVEHALNQTTMAASIRALNGAPGDDLYQSPFAPDLAIPNWLYRRTLSVLNLHVLRSNGAPLHPWGLVLLRDRLYQQTGIQIDGSLMVVIAAEMHAILRHSGDFDEWSRGHLRNQLWDLTEVDVAPVPTLQRPRLPPVESLSPGQPMTDHYPIVDWAELDEWIRQGHRHGQPTLVRQAITRQPFLVQHLYEQAFGRHVDIPPRTPQYLDPRPFGGLPLGQEQFRPVRYPVLYPMPRGPGQYERLPNIFTRPEHGVQRLRAILFGALFLSVLARPGYNQLQRELAIRAINYDAAATRHQPQVAAQNLPGRAEDAIRDIIRTERNTRAARDGIPRGRSLSPRERQANSRSQRLGRDDATRAEPMRTFPPSSSRSRERRERLGRAADNELRSMGASPGQL
ncbi:hypothetical protein LTR99_008466 [Exophiala xenobiotica]|uniref:Uncharacterized protein n=1 Tax=Vermiconidia calcicola TaxID=1690605 RepID=A0AAV9Q1D7_9PEZI|nr:hypothetical protein LTR96_004567 [Exophiala xenobiotica]KAK5532856.1 hypothetical protein LTR25_007560 [Vermiconidia calcicola]KAK5546585.1 hypothetical protein LTR23_003332 [Chaetothyriales sp. CCFEE 6169]KAK5296825.1 hypothetical protein LTR99_008466 [Exophiala xenobiotica]KAK5340189.1 hypothetical protein LTR98_003310 [Exophiala xenobiotica]